MAKQDTQYKGVKGTKINLPTLNVTQSRPLALNTSQELFAGLQNNIKTMQVFLEDRAKVAAQIQGKKIMDSNMPTKEDIDGMVKTGEIEMPFNQDTFNVVEQTANSYFRNVVSNRVFQRAIKDSNKLWQVDAYNNDELRNNLGALDQRNDNIFNTYAELFANDLAGYDNFQKNYYTYAKAQRSDWLQKSANYNFNIENLDRKTHYKELSVNAGKIYNSNEFSREAVNNVWENEKQLIQSTTAQNYPLVLADLEKAKEESWINIATEMTFKNNLLRKDNKIPIEPNHVANNKLLNDLLITYKDNPRLAKSIYLSALVKNYSIQNDDRQLNAHLRGLKVNGKPIQQDSDYLEFIDDVRTEVMKAQTSRQNVALSEKTTDINTIFENIPQDLKTFEAIKNHILNNEKYTIRGQRPTADEADDIARRKIQALSVNAPDLGYLGKKDLFKEIKELADASNTPIDQALRDYVKDNPLNPSVQKELLIFADSYDTVPSTFRTYKSLETLFNTRKAINIFSKTKENTVIDKQQLASYWRENFFGKTIEEVYTALDENKFIQENKYQSNYENLKVQFLLKFHKYSQDNNLDRSTLSFDDLPPALRDAGLYITSLSKTGFEYLGIPENFAKFSSDMDMYLNTGGEITFTGIDSKAYQELGSPLTAFDISANKEIKVSRAQFDSLYRPVSEEEEQLISERIQLNKKLDSTLTPLENKDKIGKLYKNAIRIRLLSTDGTYQNEIYIRKIK